jgi:ERCC4-type nuclease
MNKLLKSIVIIIDSREKVNSHIIDYYDKHKIKYEIMALPCGDYSFILPENKELGIDAPMYFYNDIFIERKASAEEISSNFTQSRERFNDEFATAHAKIKYLLIEGCNYEDIVEGKYNTEYNSKSFLASLHSFNIKYGLQVTFMPDKKYTPIYIYGVMQYYLRHLLK